MIKDKGIDREHAVSPVVGVMLMLVVTIIIAAVVSAFAGGLTTEKEKAPQVSLETHITLAEGWAPTEMTIKHLGGDPINTKNVKLVTSWAGADGVYHVASTVAPTYTAGVVDVSSLNTDYYGGQYNEPYLVVPGDMPDDDAGEEESLWFGVYIMRAGDVIKATGNLDPANLVTDKPVILDVDDLTGNEIINVKLIDLVSGSAIYDKNVVVEV